jgi:hypothetical protein
MARRRVPGFSFLLMVCALSAAGNLPGQTGGTVKGTVTDAVTGSPLVNTNVYLSSTTLGTTTREDGTYTLLHIPQGLYQIVASRVGHRLMSALIRVAPAETLCTNFSLEPVMLQSEEWSLPSTMSGAVCWGNLPEHSSAREETRSTAGSSIPRC